MLEEKSIILELRNITKTYPGVVALSDVSISFRKGSVHAIVGENGAGKSTFIKTITAALKADSGEIIFDGKNINNVTPEEALDMGISAIYQEFNLLKYLSVAENIFYNRFSRRGGFIDSKATERRAAEIIKRLGVKIDPKTLVQDLTVGYQQLVEIAKSFSRELKVLIMDEPSAPLTEFELKKVFEIVKTLREDGVSIIYISHRLEEIFEICDTVSVLRDGEHIITKPVAETNREELIHYMVDRSLAEEFPHIKREKGDKILEVKNLSTEFLKDINFTLSKGEILGLSGLVGSGRTELARAIFGADRITSGKIIINNKEVVNSSPYEGINNGFGLIPEDRKEHGLLLEMSILKNISFISERKFKKYGFINKRYEQEVINDYINDLKIKTPHENQLSKNLSGGNQQKVILAKWLLRNCEVLIFDEPTRGIDVGAKLEIYNLINKLVAKGMGVIIISSEMPEIIGVCDRILVMGEGRIRGEVERKDFSQKRLMHLASI